MKKTKNMCVGCTEDYYNAIAGGCWNFESATIEKRMMIPIDMRPPYSMKPRPVLSCFHPHRVANVKPEAITKDGYWK